VERGLRRAGAGGDRGAGAGPGQGERERRRGGAGTPAGGHRGQADGADGGGVAPAPGPLRPGDDVRGWRHGRRWNLRETVRRHEMATNAALASTNESPILASQGGSFLVE